MLRGWSSKPATALPMHRRKQLGSDCRVPFVHGSELVAVVPRGCRQGGHLKLLQFFVREGQRQRGHGLALRHKGGTAAACRRPSGCGWECVAPVC